MLTSNNISKTDLTIYPIYSIGRVLYELYPNTEPDIMHPLIIHLNNGTKSWQVALSILDPMTEIPEYQICDLSDFSEVNLTFYRYKDILKILRIFYTKTKIAKLEHAAKRLTHEGCSWHYIKRMIERKPRG